MKKLFAAVWIAACLLGLGGCMANQVNFSIPDAAKIQLSSGSGGATVQVVDEEDIRFITENFNALLFEKGYSSADYTGWSYSLAWYDSGGALLDSVDVVDGSKISHEGYFYACVGAGINTDFFDQLLREAE